MNGNRSNGASETIDSGKPRMCINDYNFEDGRLRASIRWLITRIYTEDNQLPDNLREPFRQNSQNRLELTTPVIACLTNGSFYCQAASRVFRDNSILTNNIGSVFHALAQAGIDVRDSEGACITEDILARQSPFNYNAHLLFIDALMTAHLRSIVSIEKVVQAISNYTSIEKREEPLDCVDALLFWINKICLLVRDDVESHGIPLATSGNNGEATIPEMEDLYEDLCDGTCICTVVSFYRPNEISLQGICFNDPMSVNDCKFNLEILKNFCSTCLPWDPFHFEIDDILYLHESLQPNVNAFLADLFNFFENQSSTPVQPEPAPAQPLQRRFMPIQPIPDLRGYTNQTTKFAAGGVAGKLANSRFGADKRDRVLSMASDDSMMTGATLKSRDSLSFASPRQLRLDPNLPVTNFGAISIDSNSNTDAYSSSASRQQLQQPNYSTATLPLAGHGQQQQKTLAEIRLQMEELRRQLERSRQLESVKQEHKRNETSKDAFFRVMTRSANNGLVGQSPPTTTPSVSVINNQPPINNDLEEHQQLKQLSNKFANQLHLASETTRSNTNSHYDQPQPQQPMIMMRSMTHLNQPQSQQHSATQQPSLSTTFNVINSQQQQTSTPYNPNYHHHHYANPYQNLSPIGPPPAGSIFSGISADNSFLFGDNPQTMTGNVQKMPHFTSPQSLPQNQGQFFSQLQQQQNYTPIPNGMPPTFHHQLAMGQQPHQQQASPFMYQSAVNYASGPANASNVNAPNFYNPSLIQQTSHQQQYNPNNGSVVPNQMQSSFSQPSHLHMIHQQQPPIGQQQQQFPTSNNFPQPLMFSSPQQQQQYGGGTTGPGVFLTQNQNQHQFSGSTVFPSTETLVIPSQQSQSQMMQQQNLMEEPRPSPFRLHQTNAPASRLDPQLELNKNLTNWGMGMTYRADDRPQRKTWVQKQAEQQQQMKQSISAQNNQSGNASSHSDPMESMNLPSALIQQEFATTNSTPEKERQHNIDEQFQMTKSSHDAFGFFNNNDNDNDVSGSSARAGGFVLEDATNPNTEMTPEMQAKRSALLASQLRRKERIVAKSEEKETETLERRQSEMTKFEQAEQRKMEREQRRQKLLEDYKRKKLEQELGEPSSTRMATSSTISLNRGHSQPPFRRPKSQTNLNIHSIRTLQRPDRTQSNMMGNGNDENVTPRVLVPSMAEPSLKLFAKHQPKSNRGLIMNALQYSVFPGHVSSENRQKAQAAIATSDSKHFLVLFRDHKLQYRALYTWDQFSDTVHKIEGQGPKVCKESMMSIMFKYDSGAKSFGQIPTKHISATIDGFVIADQYWQKPKIPHSGR